MEMNRQSLGQRISLTLRAKQYLVFFAIGLLALDFCAPPGLAWLVERRPLGELLSGGDPLFAILFSAPGAITALVVIADLTAVAFLRAGYIRSIVGSLHAGPQGTSQFLNMLGLEVITEGVRWAAAVGLRASPSDGIASVVYLAFLGAYFVLLYSDYAIVISGLDPLRAIVRSWQTGIQNVLVSLLVLFGVTAFGYLLAAFVMAPTGAGFSALLPTVTIHIVALGSVSFLADVSLIATYIDSVERGAVAFGRR